MSVMIESLPAHIVHTPIPKHPSGASLLEALLKRPPTPVSAETEPEATPMVMLKRSTSSGNYPRKRSNGLNVRRNSSIAGYITQMSPSFVSPGVILEDPEQGYFGHFPANLPTAPVCRYFALNRCWAGPHCRFTHVVQHGAYITIFPTLAVSGVAYQPTELTEQENHEHEHYDHHEHFDNTPVEGFEDEVTEVVDANGRPLCRYYRSGRCWMGANCRFAHF